MKVQQTDNRENGFGIKLELRREFLSKIKGRPIKVLDACSGSGKIWGTLANEFHLQTLRIDKKGGPGIIKMDSVRFIQSQDLSAFDAIDIDTYGECWEHYLVLKKNKTRKDNLAVTLTYGFVGQGIGVISNKVKEYIGLPVHWELDALYGKDLRSYAISVILHGVKNTRLCCLSESIYYIGFNLQNDKSLFI